MSKQTGAHRHHVKALHEAITELSATFSYATTKNRFEIRDVSQLDEESQKRFAGR
jgi:hypothetical protein